MENISDISKEVLTFLAFFDNKMLEKIPTHVITKLCEEAADSKINFYIDINKKFEEQQISEKGKDLISLIYYSYIAEENEKKEILEKWNLNEKNYQNIQKQRYNYDNLFKKRKESNNSIELIEVKKETIFQKIKNLLKKIIK